MFPAVCNCGTDRLVQENNLLSIHMITVTSLTPLQLLNSYWMYSLKEKLYNFYSSYKKCQQNLASEKIVLFFCYKNLFTDKWIVASHVLQLTSWVFVDMVWTHISR